MFYTYVYLAIGMSLTGAIMLFRGDEFDEDIEEAMGIYKSAPFVKELFVLIMILAWGLFIPWRILELLFGEQK